MPVTVHCVAYRGEPFSDLKVQWLRAGWWKLTAEFRYEHPGGCIVVPAGFELDFDSIPRIPVLHAWLEGRAQRAAVPHDWLYYAGQRTPEGGPVTRREADRIMLDAMVECGLPRRHRWPIWLGVRAGGWAPWRKHRRAGDVQGLLR
jgi:hypothetical protein